MSDEWPPKPFTAAEIEQMRRSWRDRWTGPQDFTRPQFERLLAIATIYAKPLLIDGVTLTDVERLRHIDIIVGPGDNFAAVQELKARVCDAAAARLKVAADWRTTVVDALQECTQARDHIALKILSEELGAESMLVLSTAHVPKNTAGVLDALAYIPTSDRATWSPRFGRAEGWLFHVGDKAGDDIVEAPEGLAIVLTYARIRQFPWLMLDCDGAVVEDLPRYEW